VNTHLPVFNFSLLQFEKALLFAQMDYSNIVVDAPTNWDSENDHGMAVMEEKIHILRVLVYADA
jgi:hypothetical protein